MARNLDVVAWGASPLWHLQRHGSNYAVCGLPVRGTRPVVFPAHKARKDVPTCLFCIAQASR